MNCECECYNKFYTDMCSEAFEVPASEVTDEMRRHAKLVFQTSFGFAFSQISEEMKERYVNLLKVSIALERDFGDNIPLTE